jgi:hypothetical protein
VQDNSTKAVIETPPSETWQIKFHPASDTLIVAAAGGSSSKVALWSAEDAEAKGHLGIPVVRILSPLIMEHVQGLILCLQAEYYL